MEGTQFHNKEELLKMKLSELITLCEQVGAMPISTDNAKYFKLITKVIAIKGDDAIQ